MLGTIVANESVFKFHLSSYLVASWTN